ncbi:uncharacterized protein DNG_00615 [Cephalotrichum gorgonifer]|uniref:Uncharacterized protein n=1 Tax=Cephalotrichum gorgonifer TaxID=2041049 RepID=A0AAE8MQ91_9PEZI|nr:uncharacterized protein DNG_00615 [Cephalotrichum gorgonifer]
MENDSLNDDGRTSSRRNRLMKKLFHKDKPEATQQGDLDDFFQTTASDTLEVKHAVPPPPPPSSSPPAGRVRPKLNIASASRYPQAIPVQPDQSLPLRPPPQNSPRRPTPNRKGLLVRFVDSWPDVIGEGGDECPEPTVEISKRKKARPPPATGNRQPPHQAPVTGRPPADRPDVASSGDGLPGQSPQFLQVGGVEGSSFGADEQGTISPGNARTSRFLDTSRYKDENRRSFIETHQAKMHLAEGRAFVAAAKAASPAPATPNVADSHAGEPARSRPLYESPTSRTTQPIMDPAAEQYTQPQNDLPQSPVSMDSTASSSYSQSSAFDNYSRQGSILASQSVTSAPHSYLRQNSIAPSIAPPSAVSVSTLNNSSRQNSVIAPPSASSSISGAYGFPTPSRQLSLLNQAEHMKPASRQQSFNVQDVVKAAGDDALTAFISRTRHLFELFRLHAESVRPISTSMPIPLARASLWWFIKGRMGLEMTIRNREGTPQSQMQVELDRQQAYTNIAKGYWISEMAIPELMEARGLRLEPEVEDARRALLSNLRKITMSMKRNNMLPPDEAFLPQTIDKSIWVEYPDLSQDVVALLTGNAGSGMTTTQRTTPPLTTVESLPLGDTNEYFNYSRIAVDAYLMEQGMESQRVTLPCLLSAVRAQNQSNLSFILSSQSGQVQIRIQGNKALGPTWDDVRWIPEASVLNIRLPRGFRLDIHCARQDFGMLWSMYDFGRKVQATLYPRSDELVTFQSSLPEFEYIDSDPQSRSFPKESQQNCDITLFEKVQKESIAGGTRCLHRGCRIAVVTGSHTRTLSGINQTFLPTLPIQFTFLRGNSGMPALHLKFDDGRRKGHMVLSFKDEKERLDFHMLFTGAKVGNDEVVVAKLPIAGFKLSQRLADAEGMAGLEKFPWSLVKVINDESMGEEPPTVLSDRLRVWIDFNLGTITDRMNMAPGEFKLRLEVGNPKVLRVLRLPQDDLTIGLSESHVPKDAIKDVAQCLQVVSKSQSIRSYTFKAMNDLHLFQEALTGFKVIFDAVAASFSISRRRMVVPIHKKWEAGKTRIQVVQQDKVMQMLVFFEDFHHGHCMGFVLKGTDVFETTGRGSKAGLKLVDAKFPLPRRGDEGQKKGIVGNPDDAAFVCLDLPEIPGEHDDISILFESETDRDKLCQVLPAPVKGSRLSRIK